MTNNSKLDVIVLGVLSALTIAIVGAYALIHPDRTIPAELIGLAGVVSGGLVGRAMPALTSTATTSSTPAAAGNELTGVVSALTDTLGAVLANPDTTTAPTTADASAAAAAVAPVMPVRPVVPASAPGQAAAVAPNTVQAQ